MKSWLLGKTLYRTKAALKVEVRVAKLLNVKKIKMLEVINTLRVLYDYLASLGQWIQRASGRNLPIMEPKQVYHGFLCFKVESELECFHPRL